MKKVVLVLFIGIFYSPQNSLAQDDLSVIELLIQKFKEKRFYNLSIGDTLFISIRDSAFNKTNYFAIYGAIIATKQKRIEFDSKKQLNHSLRIYYFHSDKSSKIEYSLKNRTTYNGSFKVERHCEYRINNFQYVEADH